MSIPFSQLAKNQIVKFGFSTDCCKLAFLSAVVHTAGSVFISEKRLGLSVASDNAELLNKLADLFREFYGLNVKNKGKTHLVIIGDILLAALVDCGVFRVVDGQTEVVSGIEQRIVADECCRVNYIRGAFLGAGSLSARQGYHLEFALSNTEFGEELKRLIERSGIPAKVTERAGKCVVYVKGAEAVSDCLALVGASDAVMKLNEELALRDFRKINNRINNCEYANIGRTVDASVKQVEAIKYIKRKIGLEALGDKLAALAEARLKNPEASYSELALITGAPKSTVKNRLKKLEETARELKEKKHG